MNIQKRTRLEHYLSVIISVIVNGGLFAAMLIYITFESQDDRDLQQTMVIDPVDQDIIEEMEEEIVEDVTEIQDMQDFVDFQDVDVEIDTNFEPEQEVVDAPNDSSNLNELTNLLSDIASPVQMTSLMAGRTQLARSTMVGRFGGRRAGEGQVAVGRALKWLKDHQQSDGSWTSSGEAGRGCPGHTGLALLAFLSHGETPASAEFGDTVARAIRWIVENQNANGIISRSSHTVYGHAMATYAMAEAFTVTQHVLLREPLIKAVDAIVNGMQPTGGFDYGYNAGSNRNDSSVGGWQVQALKAATIALPDNERYRQALQLAMDGMLLNSREQSEGRLTIGYTSPGSNMNITAAGALGMIFAGRARDARTRGLLTTLQAVQPVSEWDRAGRGGIYLWYYTGQALFQSNPEGRQFRTFNEAMSQALIANQNADGSWVETGEGNGGVRGRAGSTALGALNLMVYYRHLPTGMAENIPQQPAQQPGRSAADDDIITITL
jgi:hypothetical protein